MVKHTQAIRRQIAIDHFVGLALNELKWKLDWFTLKEMSM